MPAAPSTRPDHHQRKYAWIAVAVLILGVWLRAPHLWAETSLAVDEALFATYARQISHEHNPLLTGLAVDKPPLSFYANAASFLLFNEPAAWAARLPNFFASIIGLALLWRVTTRLYHQRYIAVPAVLFLALSPLDIAFAGSIFTDPIASLCLSGAALGVIAGRWAWGGALLGLAFATKQSSLQFVPLVMMLGLINRRWNPRRSLLSFGLALGVVGALPFAWGALRGHASPDWWALGIANNNPGRLIRADEVLPRLTSWLSFLSTAGGGPVPLILLTGAGIPLLLARVRRHPRRPDTTADLTLVTYALGYVLVYWLGAFNTYIRYAYALLPILALLVSRTLSDLLRWLTSPALQKAPRSIIQVLAGCMLLVTMFPAAIQARTDTPLDHLREPYNDMERCAAYLNGLSPGTIVYDHWLGWSLGWYTGQQRPPDMWLRLTYYPTPEALAADAAQQSDPAPRYFVTPDWVWTGPWLRALDRAGFRPQPAARLEHLTIYRMDPP